MPESLTIPQGSKEEIYRALVPQIATTIEGVEDLIAKQHFSKASDKAA